MLISVSDSIQIILVVAVCTQITRFFPFLFFGGKRKVPQYIKYLGDMLPPAIIAILIVYCLKDIKLLNYSSSIKEFIAVAIVVALHLWKRNTLLSIGGGTVSYMLLVQMVV